MAETTQRTPYLPLAGRSDDAFLAASGWGNCVTHPLCCLKAMPPTPASRFARRRTSPQGGGISRNHPLSCTFYWQRSGNARLGRQNIRRYLQG